MMFKTFYKGEPMPENYQEALAEKGVDSQAVWMMEDKVYLETCCEAFGNVEYAIPVIDYGTKELLYYEAVMPFLNTETHQMDHKKERWDFCPFCGKSVHRVLE